MPQVSPIELIPLLERLADNLAIVQERRGGKPAPIDAVLLLDSVVGNRAGAGPDAFSARLREMRRDGTRHLLNPTDDALRGVLVKHLGGELGLNFGLGSLYTADQVREVARTVAAEGGAR